MDEDQARIENGPEPFEPPAEPVADHPPEKTAAGEPEVSAASEPAPEPLPTEEVPVPAGVSDVAPEEAGEPAPAPELPAEEPAPAAGEPEGPAASEPVPDEFTEPVMSASRQAEYPADAEGICRALEELKLDPHPEARRGDLAGLRRRFKELQESDPAAAKPFAGRFHRADKEFNALLYQRYEARDLERWANYTLKCDILLEMENLFLGDNSTLRRAVPRLKALHANWHKLHSVPEEKKAELKERYDRISGVWHQRLDSYFARLDEERRTAAERKQAIVEAAEALQDSREWNATADILKGYQQEWRELVGAPEKLERELFLRFRAACDHFFNARNAWFKERREQSAQVIGARQAVIDELEAVDLTLPGEELRRIADGMRRRWRDSGRAGRQGEALQERFNTAMDRLYDAVRAGQEQAVGERAEWESRLAGMLEQLEAAPEADPELLREAGRALNQRGRLFRPPGRDGAEAEDREYRLVQRYQALARRERAARHKTELEKARGGSAGKTDLALCRRLTAELERFAPASESPAELSAASLQAAIEANFGGAPAMMPERVEAIVRDFLAAAPPPEEIDRFNAALERVYAKLN